MSANPNLIPLSAESTVLLRASGDIYVKGWDQTGLEVVCDGERLVNVEGDGKVVRVVAKSDVAISMFAGAGLRIEHVGGDALISGISERLEIQRVGGDLSIEKCGQVDLAVVSGDLTAFQIGGAFNIQRVGGDLAGEQLNGGISIETIGGDASFQAGKGPLRLRNGGDLRLALPPNGTEEIVLKAGGDIDLFVAQDASARLDLSSGGREIEIQVTGQNAHLEQETYVAVLGEGQLNVRARAGGDIKVSDEEWDDQDLGGHFEDEAQKWDDWRDRAGSHQENWSNWQDRVQQRVEEATRRAEERVREAMDRVDRQNRRREDLRHRFGPDFNWGGFTAPMPPRPPHAPHASHPPHAPFPPQPPQAPGAPQAPEAMRTPGPAAASSAPSPAPAAEPESAAYEPETGVSNEERMLVLKMLQEHKISIEEAEQLLKSLEGDFD